MAFTATRIWKTPANGDWAASGLIRSLLIATALAGVLAARVFVAFDAVRIKLATPVSAQAGTARIPVPRAATGVKPPFAVIVRLRNDASSAESFAIDLDGQPVCRASIASGRTSRVDCAMRAAWMPGAAHALTVSGPGADWAVDYAEIATHHGRAGGLLDVRLVPAGSRVAVTPGPGWIVVMWLLVAAGLLLPPLALPRWLRLVYGAGAALIAVLVAVAAISPWVSPYAVLISAAAYAKWLVWLLSPRLAWGMGWLARRLPRSPRELLDRVFQRTADPPIVPGAMPPLHLLRAALGLCLFGAVLLHPQLMRMHSVPDLGDPLFSIWRVGWVFHQIQGDPRPLFDANIFYPAHLTLTLSDSMLLPALTVAPLLAARVHPVVAYNVLMLSGFLLSGLATYVLVARLTRSLPAAFIAALIFGFYPYRFEHYSHLELQMTEWMPLGLLALHYFWTTPRLRYALAAALCAVANMYSSMYYGVFFVLYAIPVSLVLLAILRPPVRRLWPPALAAAALAVVLLVPLARPYVAAQSMKGERNVAAVEFYSAEPSDYLQAHPRSALYGGWLEAHHPERALFPGVMALVLAVCGLALPLGVTRAAYAVGLAAAFDASLGFHGFTYPIFYDLLSPVRGMRVAARFSVIAGMTLAVLAGFGAKRIIARGRTPRRRAVICASLVVLVAIDLWPILRLEPVWDRPPAIYGGLKASASHPVVLAEFPMRWHDAAFTENLPFMYFSLWHWLPMVNGYSGFTTAEYEALVLRERVFPDPEALDALAAHGATHVSVNCALYMTPPGCAEMVDTLDASPRLHRLVATRWEGAPVRLYELR
jgi:hypothetical protein